MKKNDVKSRLEKVYGSSLSLSEYNKIMEIVEDRGYTISDLDNIVSINSILELSDPIPDSNGMDASFYSMVEAEKFRIKNSAKRFNFSGIAARIAAGIALFIMGWFGSAVVSNNFEKSAVASLANELSDLKENLVLTLLQQSSPSDRIQAVTMVGEMESVDEKIVNGLLKVLNMDPNTNVRLVALETLIQYSDKPDVREGIIRSIGNQSSPVLQLRLAEIMIFLEEKRSVPEFQKILEDATIDYGIRSKLDETVKVLL